MFKLESYITPLLMGYVDKYVKLKQEDFQLSLWGGDAVLNKLDLRLDAIEKAIKLPVTFKSGFIHELRIHVPWTKLGSEPVVVTINTIECILKLRDSSSDDRESVSSKSSSSVRSSAVAKPKKQDAEELPPGYLQSLVNRILNNINIVINNLILKFVEDDIVLSMNVKSAECYSVNADWTRSFIELSPSELILRRVVNLHDATLCLDKRNASGKIETYQDPLAYRCSITCRLYMAYDSLHAKFPSTTKMHFLCEKLDLSLTDTQVPMFFRLLELVLAIYYGTLELPAPSAENDSGLPNFNVPKQFSDDKPEEPPPDGENGEQSWMGWAWSYMPPLLPSGDNGEGEDYLEEENRTKKKPEPAVLEIGFYVHKASVVFKLTEIIQETSTYYTTPQRVQFKPCMCWEAQGISCQALLRGLLFFNVQFGITSTQVRNEGEAICGIKDTDNPNRDPCFCHAGNFGQAQTAIGYMIGSLFDEASPENQDDQSEFIFDGEKHLETYTEEYALQKYGAFWMDYLYTMEVPEDEPEEIASVSTISAEEFGVGVRESSSIRLLIGPGHLIVSSSMEQRIQKFLFCMSNNEYEPYSKAKPEVVDDNRAPPSSEEIEALEEYIPTRSFHLTFVKPTVTILTADLPKADVTKRKVISARRLKRSSKNKTQEVSQSHLLPAVILQADRFDYQRTAAMYPRRLVRQVSKIPAPSHNLVHHCHSHQYIKLFGLQCGLTYLDVTGRFGGVQSMMQPCSAAFYLKQILLPDYWKNPLQPKSESMYELPSLSVSMTKAHVMAVIYVLTSWLQKTPAPAKLSEYTLLEDIFGQIGLVVYQKQPILQLSLAMLEVKQVTTQAVISTCGTLSAVQVVCYSTDEGKDVVTPLLYGPLNTAELHKKEFFLHKPVDGETERVATEVVNFSLQFPRDINDPQAPSIVLLDIKGISACLDPLLYDWIMYAPLHKFMGLVFSQTVRTDASTQNQSQGSNVTEPTDSRSVSHSRSQSRTMSHTPTDGQPSLTNADNTANDSKAETGFGKIIASYIPLAKMTQVQVDIASTVIFLPTARVHLPEPTMNIPANLQTLYGDNTLPPTVVVCLPRVHITSASHKHMIALQDIPIRQTELSISSEKLPWSIEMLDFTVYSLHPRDKCHYMIKPSSLSATLAVTTKYNPPVSDNISSLAFCIHSDMEPITTACCNEQVQLIYDLAMKGKIACDKLITSLEFFTNVSCASPAAAATSKLGAASVSMVSPTAQVNKSQTVVPTSAPSSLLDPVITDTIVTETSDDLMSREDSPSKDLEDRSKVKLSLWFQWTLPKILMRLYSRKKTGEEICLSTEVEDLALSVDVQEVYSKVECKIGSTQINHYTKSDSKEESLWSLGDHQGIILSCTEKLSRNTCILSNKQWSSAGTPVGQLFGLQEQKPRDKNHGFMSLTFTRALRRSVKKKMKKYSVIEKLEQTSLGLERSEIENFYLNEVCVNIQPCDVVLNCPVLSCVVNTFAIKTLPRKLPSGSMQKQVNKEEQKKTPELPWITSSLLPLIYINANNFRLFVPTVTFGQNSDGLNHSSRFDSNNEKQSDGRHGRESAEHRTSVGSHSHVEFAHRHSLDNHAQGEEPPPGGVSDISSVTFDRHSEGSLTQHKQNDGINTSGSQDGSLTARSTADIHSPVGEGLLAEQDSKGNQTSHVSVTDLNEKNQQNKNCVNLLGHDTFVMQVVGLTLSPQADNPLPRIVIEKDIYRRALHAGITSLPGSEVEDRQYQLDVCGLGFCTGKWQELVMDANSESQYQKEQKAEVQIPALEWNNFMKLGNDKELVQLYPLSQCFDLKAVYAPAIVYQIPNSENKDIKQVLVCGHSLEINAISDMDFSICTSQIWLMKEIAGTNISAFLHQSEKPQRSHIPGSHESRDESVEVSLHDSGVESEVSNNNTNVGSPNPQRNGSLSPDWLNFTPFDILLTAGRISFLVYSHKPYSCEEFKPSTPAVRSKLTKSDLEYKDSLPSPTLQGNMKGEFGKDGEEDSSGESVLPIFPYFYAYFAQPHTVLTVQKNNQKLELSCYDVILKGAKVGHCIRDDSKLLPDIGDFSVHWIETRPGKANPKTGIPPSLYTFQVTNFLIQPAEIKLKLERPMKLNLSISKLQQLTCLLEEILPMMGGDHDVNSHGLKDKTKLVNREDNSVMKLLAHVGVMNFLTVQVVVAVETIPHVENAMVLASVKEIDGEVSLKPNSEGSLEELTACLCVREFLIKTAYCGKSRPLVGPFSSSLNVSTEWCTHSGPAGIPKILTFLDSSIVQMFFGQEHAMCLNLVSQHILQYIESISGKKESKKPADSDKVKKHMSSPKKLEVLTPTTDDLRMGSFEYITDDTGAELLPSPCEIMFGVETDDDRPIMTWCYPHPRVLTSVEVTPVPLTPPKSSDTGFLDMEKIKVPCLIQYWDVLTRRFVDYAELAVSENESTQLELPRVSGVLPSGNDIAAAQVWRTVVLHPHDRGLDHEQQLGDDSERESLLSPLTLAASMRVDSCFVPALVSVLQVSVSCSMVQLHLQNHLQHLGTKTPHKLLPYTLDKSGPNDQQVLVLTLDSPQIYVTEPVNNHAWSRLELSCTAQCDVFEYRNLTMTSMLDHTDLQAMVTMKKKPEGPTVNCNMSAHPLFVRGGQGAIHTLTMATKCWKQIGSGEGNVPVMNYYVICNDTNETIKIGQAETDEMIPIHSRHCHPYSWRTHKNIQTLAISVEGLGGQWCEPINMDHVGTSVRVIENKGHKVTLIIKVKKLTNVQKQVLISGQLVVSSRLDQHLEVRLLTHKSSKDSTGILGSKQTRPSYIVEHTDMRALKVRLLGMKSAWSQEIAVTGDDTKDSKLIKVPLHEKGNFIHVWCHIFSQNHKSIMQNLEKGTKLTASVRVVMFTPIFVVRTHLPTSLLMNIHTPRLKATNQVQLEGQGQEQQLNIIGGDTTHNITFQLGPTMKPSNPAISLSSGMIDQVQKVPLLHPDIHKLCYDWLENQASEWPYNTIAEETSLLKRKPEVSGMPVPPKPRHSVVMPQVGAINSGLEYEQPNIDLKIQLEQYWPGCNTLLIDVKPYWLLVNDTGLDLLIIEANQQQWALPKDKIFAPPPFEGTFCVGLLYKEQLHTSDPVQLSEDDTRPLRYLPATRGILYTEGYTQIAVFIKNQQVYDTVCFLTLHSTYKDGMRVITVRETYSLCNNSRFDLNTQLYNIPLSDDKVEIDVNSLSHTNISAQLHESEKRKDKSELTALLFWNIIEPLQEADDNMQFVQYISFRHQADNSNTDDPRLWSQPIRTDCSEQGRRSSVNVPIRTQQMEMDGEGYDSQSYVLTGHMADGMVYLVIEEDTDPDVVLYNRCTFPLLYGQTLLEEGFVQCDDGAIQEETELITNVPTIMPLSRACYTFPAVNTTFPEVPTHSSIPKLHLAGDLAKDPDEENYVARRLWSYGIDLASEHDSFISIPELCDVKVHIERVGYTFHIHIDPVTRAEVSAKEIRSRIKGKETTVVIESPKKQQPHQHKIKKKNEVALKKANSEDRKNAESEGRVNMITAGITKFPNQHTTQVSNVMQLKVSLLCRHGSITLLDETSDSTTVKEILRITVDNAFLAYYPLVSPETLVDMRPSIKQLLTVYLGDFQMDNQMHSLGMYDFSVVFLKQNNVKVEPLPSKFDDLSLTEKLECLRDKGLIQVTCTLCKDLTSSATTLQNVDIAIKPVSVFIEDAFIYNILEKIDSFIATRLSKVEPVPKRIRKLPQSVRNTSCMLSHPIRLESLIIRQVSLLLSVHASLKLFIASDNTPLTIGSFERQAVFTTVQQLTKAVTMHYVSGALFRAGWVVGSLEILGNPTGLVRNIGTGIGDLFRMPYEGLTRGPGAFIRGVSQGMGSLLKHVSTGTLMSITNFASSMSRNMDKLSLDSDHCLRQEETRRHRPDGLGTGLKQGLTGFGLSLLGAVAGLADQPLQGFLTRISDMEEEDAPKSPTRAASGIMSGMGRGLMGVVTKPLGGAAELVSQTGQGLLQGAGLVYFPTPRYTAAECARSADTNSQVKYLWKMLHTVSNLEVIMSLDVTLLHTSSPSVSACLLLTPDILFVINTSEDTQQQALAVSEVDCTVHPSDRSILCIVNKNRLVQKQLQDEDHNKDRVAAFIGNTLGYSTPDVATENPVTMATSEDSSAGVQYTFHVDPRFRDLFITLFRITRDKLLGVGFSI